MNKKIIIGIFVSFLFLSLLVNGRVLAHEKKYTPKDCHIFHITPTPTLFVTTTPTLSLTPTPTATASPTPTQAPCTDNCGNSPTFAGSTTNAPSPKTCTISMVPPGKPIFTRLSDSEVNLKWWPSTDNGGIQSIEYGLNENDLKWGVLLPTATGDYTIGSLPSNTSIWAKVCLYKNGCSACTDTIDP